MKNFFFDLLPIEIREVIYGIRLSNALKKNYCMRRAKKVALVRILMKLEMSYDFILYQYGDDHSMPYFNPLNSNVRYVAERCSQVAAKADAVDHTFWISQLIRPLEQGLISKQQDNYFEATFDWSRLEETARRAKLDAIDNYRRTEHVVDRLIQLFGCRRNPNRASLWSDVLPAPH